MKTYENAQYQISPISGQKSSISVLIDGLNSSVPIDEQNTDYQNIMTLVAEGKLTIAPAEAQ